MTPRCANENIFANWRPARHIAAFSETLLP
jgi:hypothetical protein